MRYLGIDWGAKRIGIALSDEGGNLAFAHSVLRYQNFDTFLKTLKYIVQKEGVITIVIGLPLGMAQQDTAQTRIARETKERIETAFEIPVVFENELFTSKLASRVQGDTDKNDASAAALILQSFLDRLKDV